MMNQLTVQIRKGGTCKTTSSVSNLAQLLDETGYWKVADQVNEDCHDNDINKGE